MVRGATPTKDELSEKQSTADTLVPQIRRVLDQNGIDVVMFGERTFYSGQIPRSLIASFS